LLLHSDDTTEQKQKRKTKKQKKQKQKITNREKKRGKNFYLLSVLNKIIRQQRG